MCKTELQSDCILKAKIKLLESKIKQCRETALKIKATSFKGFQSFDYVQENYEKGEIYNINSTSYAVITNKTENIIEFVIIMKANKKSEKVWQDEDRILEIKQGTYLDLFTQREYKSGLKIKAFDVSYFKAIGEDDLIIKGILYR